MNYNTYANKIKKVDHDISALVNIKNKTEYKVIGNDIDDPMPAKWPYHTGYIYAGGWLTEINPHINIGDIIYQNNLDENFPRQNSEEYNDYLENFILYAQTGNLVYIPFFSEVVGQHSHFTTVKMNYSATRRFFFNGYELNSTSLLKGMKPIVYNSNFDIINTNQIINIDFNYAPMLPFLTEAVIPGEIYFQFKDELTIETMSTISTTNDEVFTIKVNNNTYHFNQIYFNDNGSIMCFRYHYTVEEKDPTTGSPTTVDYYSPNITVYSNGNWTSEIYKQIKDSVFITLVNKNSLLADQGVLHSVDEYETLIIDNSFKFDTDNKPLLNLITNSSYNYKWLWR